MSDNRELLRTTSFKGMLPARIRNQDAVDTYRATIVELQKRCGNEAASLFSEPVRPSKPDPANPQITWYTPLDGQLLDMATIDEIARRPIISLFRRRIEQLKPALDDPQLGPVVASWLNITSTGDLVSVGGKPVLINWGYLPEDIARSGIRREAHFGETIGRHVRGLQRPPFSAEEAAAYGDRVHNDARAPLAPAATIANAPTPAEPAPAAKAPAGTGLMAPLIANALAAILLAILLWPGMLIWPSKDSQPAGSGDTTPLTELEQRADTLEAQARERVSRPPNRQLPSLTPPPGQAAPPNVSPRTDLSPSGGAVATPPETVGAVLAGSVVMAIGKSDDGHSKLGSGFFVSNHHIAANRYVVDGLAPDSIQVTSKALGQAIPARLMATSSPASAPNNLDVADFALLNVSTSSRNFLSIGPSPQNSSNVVAAGYPASAMKNDADFLTFVNGNDRAAPPSVNKPGSILQRRDGAPVKYLTHSASLENGSGGGPLVNDCGRVVGINTQVRNEADPPTTPNQAQDVSDFCVFLEKNGVTLRIDDAQKPCPPAAPGVATAAPPATPAPGAGSRK